MGLQDSKCLRVCSVSYDIPLDISKVVNFVTPYIEGCDQIVKEDIIDFVRFFMTACNVAYNCGKIGKPFPFDEEKPGAYPINDLWAFEELSSKALTAMFNLFEDAYYEAYDKKTVNICYQKGQLL